MKAIFPAAGYATRMGLLTSDKPKALLDINGKAVIEYGIEKICELEEVDDVFIVTNDKFYSKFLEWGSNFKCNKRLEIINDCTRCNEERLGTIGDLYYVLRGKDINEDFVVVNSDNLFSFSLKGIYDYFKKRKSSVIGIYDSGCFDIVRNMGNPKINSEGKIIDFKEKDPNVKSTLCSIGIYFFNKEIKYFIYKYIINGNPPDRSGDFIAWLYKRKDVYGYLFEGEWFDIGTIESYKKALMAWANLKAQ